MITLRRRFAGALFGAGMALLVAGPTAAHAAAPQPKPKITAVAALAFDPVSETLLKATSNALYRSADEGRTWVRLPLPAAAARGPIAAVAVSARDKSLLYVAGPGMGVLRSDDGGKSWSARNNGMPVREVVALAAHADQPDTLYAFLAGHGLFRSEDAGGSWRLMDKGPRQEIVRLVHSNMPGSMQSGWFFAATAKGVSRAMDCFCGWRDAGGLAGRIAAVSYDPTRPQRVYAVAADGIFRSDDGGEQWTKSAALATAITAMVVAPRGTLYAAASDGALYRSADEGKTWQKING